MVLLCVCLGKFSKFQYHHPQNHCLVFLLCRLGKNKLQELRGVHFLKRSSANFVKFSAKFGSLNMQIRNNFGNIIFIVCKWSKICKYHGNIMYHLSKGRKNMHMHGLNIWFTLFCCNLKFVVIYTICPPNLYSQNVRVHKKIVFFKSASMSSFSLRWTYSPQSLTLIFSLSLSSWSLFISFSHPKYNASSAFIPSHFASDLILGFSLICPYQIHKYLVYHPGF